MTSRPGEAKRAPVGETPPVFCVNCRHHELGMAAHFCVCRKEYNLVTGGGTNVECGHERSRLGVCGPTGQNYEARDES